MADLNNVTIVGRVTRDAVLKQVGASELCEFSVANNTGFGKYECTNFFKVTLWGKRATSLQSYLTKGKQVGVTGQMENKVWTDQQGIKHDSWTINANDVCLMASPQGQTAPTMPAPQSAAYSTVPDNGEIVF